MEAATLAPPPWWKILFRFRISERKLLALAAPLVVHNVLFTLMGFVDSLMVGQLGEDTISAVGNAAQVQMFLFLLFAAIGQGGGILMAQHYGAKDKERLEAVASTTLGSGLVIGLTVALASWVGAPTFLWLLTLGRSPEVVALGSDYLRIVAVSYLFMTPGNMAASALRSTGDTRTPVYIAVISNAINIVGNAVLIFGLGPFPELGYRGAAISTVLAQVVQGLWLLWAVTRPKANLGLTGRNLFRIRGAELKKIVALGYPMSIDGIYWQGARIAFTLVFNYLGSSAYAAYTIVRNLKGMATLPSGGLQTAAMISVGQTLGRERFALARMRAAVGIRMSLWIMAVPSVAVILFAPALVGLFNIGPETRVIAEVCTRILGVSMFFTTLNSVVPGILRAGGDTVVVMKYTLLSFLLIGGPLAMVLGIALPWGAVGAFLGVSLEEVAKAGFFVRRWLQGRWLKKLG